MSVYTTLKISRQKALEIWMKDMGICPSNNMLEEHMDIKLEPHLRNCIVRDHDSARDDDHIQNLLSTT